MKKPSWRAACACLVALAAIAASIPALAQDGPRHDGPPSPPPPPPPHPTPSPTPPPRPPPPRPPTPLAAGDLARPVRWDLSRDYADCWK
jgi:hypothetical protein